MIIFILQERKLRLGKIKSLMEGPGVGKPEFKPPSWDSVCPGCRLQPDFSNFSNDSPGHLVKAQILIQVV